MRQIGDGIRIGGGIRILFSKPFMYSLRKTAYTCNGKEVDNKINTIFMFTVAPAAYISLLHDKININPYIGACISFHSIRNSVIILYTNLLRQYLDVNFRIILTDILVFFLMRYGLLRVILLGIATAENLYR